MPNLNSPFGLRPSRHKNGAPYNGAVNPYYIPSSYGTALYVGDPVIITGTSNTAEVTAAGYGKFGPGTLPEINKATAAGGAYISGVIVGFAPLPTDLGKQYNAASTERVALVCDDPDVLFEVQEDIGGTALAAVSVGLNVDMIFTNAGSTVTGMSGVEIDRSTAATTNTLQFKIMRLVNRVDNEIGDYAKWLVMANLHTQRDLTGR